MTPTNGRAMKAKGSQFERDVVRVLRAHICSIDGCDKPVLARGWCSKHWTRWRRNGNPHEAQRNLDDPLAHIRRRVSIVDECWVWQGRSRSGRERQYGRMKWKGRIRVAHLQAYELLVGAVPEGLVLDHLCRNGLCVNPDHLEPVTQQENIRRGSQWKSHCPQGHPYDEANTYVQVRADGISRQCRACGRARYHRRKGLFR